MVRSAGVYGAIPAGSGGRRRPPSVAALSPRLAGRLHTEQPGALLRRRLAPGEKGEGTPAPAEMWEGEVMLF